MQGKRMRYQMLWGALLTVRRMVMRPPASTPTGLTRAWPRKLVVCCSADAAIFAVSCVFGGARTMRMLVGLSGNSGTGAHLYTTSEWRSRRDWWTRAGAAGDIARPSVQWPSAKWWRGSRRPNPKLSGPYSSLTRPSRPITCVS
jgi:hypothetical protein